MKSEFQTTNDEWAGVVEVFALRKLRRRAQRQATAANGRDARFARFVPPASRAGFSQRENLHQPRRRFGDCSHRLHRFDLSQNF
jgi:hypothetical protein